MTYLCGFPIRNVQSPSEWLECSTFSLLNPFIRQFQQVTPSCQESRIKLDSGRKLYFLYFQLNHFKNAINTSFWITYLASCLQKSLSSWLMWCFQPSYVCQQSSELKLVDAFKISFCFNLISNASNCESCQWICLKLYSKLFLHFSYAVAL